MATDHVNDTPPTASLGGPVTGERTLGQLIADATQDVTEIVRGELELAKAELKLDVRNAAVGGGLFAVAGYLALLASILAPIAGAYGLVEAGVEPWLAFLIVTAGLLLLAGVLVLIGRSRLRRVGPPERAIRSTRETIAAVKPGSRTR